MTKLLKMNISATLRWKSGNHMHISLCLTCLISDTYIYIYIHTHSVCAVSFIQMVNHDQLVISDRGTGFSEVPMKN